jgi:5-oxoprolinase (ATP-hydrolysing)
VLKIANQDRPRLFDLAIRKPESLFQEVVEIDARMDAEGRVLRMPNEAVIREQLAALHATGVESIAICLLHSFANPEHEQIIERLARDAGFVEISTSSRLSPLIKIVSRGGYDRRRCLPQSDSPPLCRDPAALPGEQPAAD